jgi:GTP-binding protein HflX
MGSQYHHQSRRGQADRALIVHPVLHGTVQPRSPEACLAEAVGLAHAINLDVAQARTVKVNRPQPATLLGGGTVAELAGLIAEAADRGQTIGLVNRRSRPR